MSKSELAALALTAADDVQEGGGGRQRRPSDRQHLATAEIYNYVRMLALVSPLHPSPKCKNVGGRSGLRIKQGMCSAPIVVHQTFGLLRKSCKRAKGRSTTVNFAKDVLSQGI